MKVQDQHQIKPNTQSCQTSVIASTDLNRVHHADFLDNSLPDKCANLILADPPYYKVKGDFDFIWKSFDDYLKDVEKWSIECKRLLADNGTLFWYGHAKNIAYAQVVFDLHFNLINNLVWDKGSFMGLEESEGLRSFAPCTERILMYGNKDLKYSPFSFWIKKNLEKNNLKMNDVDIELNYVRKKNPKRGTELCRRWCEGNSVPKNEDFIKMQVFFNDFIFEYDELLKEYDELRRPFVNYFKLQEIFRFSNEAQKTGAKYDHETVKPETLTRALILTCSRENDLVVIPFAGSGTECAMSVKENRKFVAYEITEKHVNMSNKRVKKILDNPPLFAGL